MANLTLRFAAFVFCRLLPVAALVMPLLAAAQDQLVFEEIVVTAQKREQSIRDVPISVGAYDTESLNRAGVEDIRDLQQLAPSLMLTASQAESAGTVARIRGIGTTGDNLGLESSVAVFIDGVYRNRNNVALTDLGELDRIEVLRGPQGTLFGKNASAGLIHVITRKPDIEQFRAYGEGSLGDYEYWRLATGVTGPIGGGETGFRIDASWNEREGFIRDAIDGSDYNDRDRWLVRGQLAGVIGDALDWRLIADLSDREETCCAAVTEVAGPTTGAIAAVGGTVITPADPFDRNTTANAFRGYGQNTEEWGLSLELNWSIGPGELTSISAYREWDSARTQDADFTNADILHRSGLPSVRSPSVMPNSFENDFETLTQEIRYAGSTGAIDWMAGFYFVDEQLRFRDAIRVGAAYEGYVNGLLFGVTGDPARNLSFYTGLPSGSVFLDGDGVQRDNWRQDTESWALFTHNTWNITDRLDLTLGLRYTDEEKDLTGTLAAENPACLNTVARIAGGMFPIAPDPANPEFTTVFGLTCLPLINPFADGNYSDSRSDEETTGTLNVSYDLADDWLAWISYGRGYKAGGYNLDRGGLLANPLLGQTPAPQQLEFEPETVDAFEAGARGTLWDGRLQLNIAAFLAQFDDFQLNTFTGTNFVVTNQKEVETKGVELDFSMLAFDGLLLTGGVTYTDARYDDDIADASLAGRRITHAPYWIATGAATYERPFGSFLGTVHLSYRFVGDHNTGSDLDPAKRQGAYTLWNGSLTIGSQDENWEVEVWTRNLFDKEYRQVVITAPLQTGSYLSFLGDPRTAGVTVRVKF